MITVVVYEEGSRRVLAAIPLDERETAICRNDIGFQVFRGTEPVFTETEDGPILKENSFFINFGGNEDAKKT